MELNGIIQRLRESTLHDDMQFLSTTLINMVGALPGNNTGWYPCCQDEEQFLHQCWLVENYSLAQEQLVRANYPLLAKYAFPAVMRQSSDQSNCLPRSEPIIKYGNCTEVTGQVRKVLTCFWRSSLLLAVARRGD